MAPEITREILVLDDHASASASAARLIVEARPRTMALSGGATPVATYDLLAEEQIEWSEVDLFLADERMLPSDHPGSNARLIHEHLAIKTGARLHRVDVTVGPEEAARAYAQRIADHWPLDLVLLGVGGDGHTASLFPNPSPPEAGDLVIPTWSKSTGTWRVSLSYAAIAGCRDVVILVTGADKRDAVARMMRGDDIPAAKISGARRTVVITDRAAYPS